MESFTSSVNRWTLPISLSERMNILELIYSPKCSVYSIKYSLASSLKSILKVNETIFYISCGITNDLDYAYLCCTCDRAGL